MATDMILQYYGSFLYVKSQVVISRHMEADGLFLDLFYGKAQSSKPIFYEQTPLLDTRAAFL
jgi:hypothetical protein